jgi:hypothetical protein
MFQTVVMAVPPEVLPLISPRRLAGCLTFKFQCLFRDETRGPIRAVDMQEQQQRMLASFDDGYSAACAYPDATLLSDLLAASRRGACHVEGNRRPAKFNQVRTNNYVSRGTNTN